MRIQLNTNHTNSKVNHSGENYSASEELAILSKLNDAILNDPKISEAEKSLLRQLNLDNLQLDEASSSEMNGAINGLVGEYRDSAYAYLYHYMKAVAVIQHDSHIAIQELDQSIQLNSNFSLSYLARATLHFTQNNFMAGVSDLRQSANLGNNFAAECLSRMGQ